MKKLLFGLIATVMLSFSSFANQINPSLLKNGILENKENPLLGKIRIKFHGGNLCWLSGNACEGEILIEWKSAPPKDINPISVPKGYQLMTMETTLFEKVKRDFEERTFSRDETEDYSTIYVPKQVGQYSKELDAFVVYAQVK
jgi:hypothetical protein